MTVIAAMTAFYMFRLYYGIFWGGTAPGQSRQAMVQATYIPPRISPDHDCSVNLPGRRHFAWPVSFPFGHFISSNGESYTIHLETSVAVTSVVIAVASIVLATCMYLRQQHNLWQINLPNVLPDCTVQPYHRFYIDEVYQFITHRIIFRCISTPIAWFDRHVVDGFFNFIAWGTHATSDEIRGIAKRTCTAIRLCIPARSADTYLNINLIKAQKI